METMLRNKADFFQKNVFYLLFYQTYQTTLVQYYSNILANKNWNV